MPTAKTHVIELMFWDQRRWEAGTLVSPAATLREVSDAIARANLDAAEGRELRGGFHIHRGLR